ncbi:hypothetical protein EDC04DRAFT_2609957 [Pisolithus marmoratus]|nr:hypothetical protein EDC04DRAFT_2609957 [Pisolithus marmoratus]
MALQSAGEAGKMQTSTIIGIILGLMGFIILVLSIWTISYWFRNRDSTQTKFCPLPTQGQLPTSDARVDSKSTVPSSRVADRMGPSGPSRIRSSGMREEAVPQRQAVGKTPANSNGG